MSIKRLYKDVFERVNFLDKNVENPFLKKEKGKNPFSNFFGGTYVWVDPPEKTHETCGTSSTDKKPFNEEQD